jgi:hypothetical protein
LGLIIDAYTETIWRNGDDLQMDPEKSRQGLLGPELPDMVLPTARAAKDRFIEG